MDPCVLPSYLSERRCCCGDLVLCGVPRSSVGDRLTHTYGHIGSEVDCGQQILSPDCMERLMEQAFVGQIWSCGAIYGSVPEMANIIGAYPSPNVGDQS